MSMRNVTVTVQFSDTETNVVDKTLVLQLSGYRDSFALERELERMVATIVRELYPEGFYDE